MKIAAHIAATLLGLMFIFASVMVLFKLAPTPPAPPEGTPPAHFMAAFAPTGYLTFVKVFELLGGLLVVVPRTRNLGLLVLGPIIINILAFHIFVTGGEGVGNPMLIGICVLALFLLWSERKAFACLVTRPSGNKN
ncbi:MAG TPA: hypothetical protein VGF13_10070 [Verrucomicrobiae bacterium]|jgi:hypothetical protein